VFYGVVFGEMIKVDSSPVAAKEDSSEGQEISQRFGEMIYVLDRVDESADREVFAVAIDEAMIRKCVQARARRAEVGWSGRNEGM